MQKILFVPIEIKSRDYFSRLLISQIFASKGFDVYFGRKREIELLTKFFSNSFYLGLQSTKTYIPFYKKLKKKNFKILVYDEEGLVPINEKIYLSTRASEEIFDTIDYFICWGNKQFSLVYNNISKKKRRKVLNLGNPRIDILKKKYRPLFNKEITQIKIKNYILINTTFGQANHFFGEKKLIIKYETNNFLKSRKEKLIFYKFREFKKKRFILFNDTILDLVKKNPDINFVIRPHPSEDIEKYKFLKIFPNVLVTKKYNVIPWILKSKLVISDYCSTSIEAKMLGVPSLNYKVPTKINFLDKTFYEDSIKIKNFSELNNIINKKKSIKLKKISNLKKRLINTDKKFSSSKKLFYHVINSYNFNKKRISIKDHLTYIFGKITISIYLFIFKNLYSEEKCKNIDKSYLINDLDKIIKIEKQNNLKIKRTCQSVYKICL